VIRDRVVAGAVAAVGLVFAVPTVFEPTWRLVVSDHGSVLSTQSSWSWGRYVTGGTGGTLETVDNLGGLVVLLAALLLGAAGITLWLVVRGLAGTLAGVISTTVLATRVVTTSAERFGRNAQEQAYRSSGLDVSTFAQPAAVLESIAAVLLVGAVAFMVVALVQEDAASHASTWQPGSASESSFEPSSGSRSAMPPVAVFRPRRARRREPTDEPEG
jgi:hypothetical protein